MTLIIDSIQVYMNSFLSFYVFHSGIVILFKLTSCSGIKWLHSTWENSFCIPWTSSSVLWWEHHKYLDAMKNGYFFLLKHQQEAKIKIALDTSSKDLHFLITKDKCIYILQVRLQLHMTENSESWFWSQVNWNWNVSIWKTNMKLFSHITRRKLAHETDCIGIAGSAQELNSNLDPYELNYAVRHGFTSSTLNWCNDEHAVQMQNTWYIITNPSIPSKYWRIFEHELLSWIRLEGGRQTRLVSSSDTR